MLATEMKSYSGEVGTGITKYTELCIAMVIIAETARTTHMEVRHGVYFDGHEMFSEYANGKWADTADGAAIRRWLTENTPGKYAIQSSRVLFEDHDDALLCYLRYKG